MTHDDALLYIKILSRHFRVPAPRLRWRSGNTRGYYKNAIG